MANSNFGLKIGVEGEREFKKALNDINSQMKVLGSEMKVVEARFSSQDRSVEALTARNEVLNKNIEAQKEKIETLKKALENASSSFGENDKRTQAWAIQLNNAQADLIKLEKELHKNNDELKNAGNRMDDTGDAADDMGDDIEDAGDEAEESSHKFEGLGKVCKACAATIAAAFAAVGAAAVTAGKKLIEMMREGAAYADTVLTESTVTGIATDKLQEYMYAAELVDVSVDTLTKSMAKQIKSMQSYKEGSKNIVAAYDQIGVSVLDAEGNLRDSDEVYWEIIDALGKMENETERDALAMTLLGKSAQELNPLITAGAERMAELGQQAREAGYVVSDDMLNAYGKFDDQLQYLKVGCTAAKNALGTLLLPILTDLAGEGVGLLGKFTNGIKDANGDISAIGDVIGDILPEVVNVITSYLPQVLKIISSFLLTLVNALVDNLPIIIDAASEIIFALIQGITALLPQVANCALQLITTLATGLLSNLPAIIEAAMQVIVTLVQGIAQALPTLIPSVVNILTTLVQTIIDNLPLVLDAALQLVMGLAQGILAAIPVLLDALPQIILSIVDFILNAIDISDVARRIGQFVVRFNCQPWLYADSGETTITRTSSSFTLSNPYGFESKPYIRLYGSGSGTLTIQGGGSNRVWQFTDVADYIEIDSALMNFYKGTVPKNNTVSGSGFPSFAPGTNAITLSGFTRIEIEPRWRTL